MTDFHNNKHAEMECRIGELCELAGFEMPEVRWRPLRPEGGFNAHARHRKNDRPLITIDASALLLDSVERDALLAHELGHVADPPLASGNYREVDGFRIFVCSSVIALAGVFAIFVILLLFPNQTKLSAGIWLLVAAAFVPTMRMEMKWKQKREYFADEFGARLLGSAEPSFTLHLRRREVLSDRQWKRSESRTYAWLSTHPTYSDREARLRALKF